MLRFVARHLLHVLAVLLLVTLLAQFLIELVPGSPATAILGETADPETVQAVNAEFGFDDPAPARYARWLGDVVTGSFGTSYRTGEPVFDSIRERIPVSLELAVGALVLALVVSVPLAMASAQRPGGRADKIITATTSAVISVPSFMLALGLLYVFAMQLGWFEVVSAWVPLTSAPLDNLQVAAMPILALAVPEIAVYTRVLRSDLIGTLQEDYIIAARARGLSSGYVLRRHALRPSSFSLLTVAGLSLGRLMGGAIIVETVFSLPGLGQLMVSSIQTNDLLTVLGLVTFLALAYVVVNTAIDIAYGYLDPRVRALR